ncbi:LytTR family DNA-binding domain-containing protein [Solibacillus sp. FSL W7-1464]|uniref:LytTR family DNA-binding domain-containing protein n=1 Tax=Solibacillus sp. FSL W7-1464 TaxID=2921706 RepID=UPI0030F6A271
MKIHLHIEQQLSEIEVHVHAPEYGEQVAQLLKKLNQATKNDTIAGYIDGDIHLIKMQDVYSIYSEQGKVYIQTDEQELEVKQKLYELEERFSTQLIRVNKATLVHFEKIASIQSKVLGNPQLTLENGVMIPISRNYFKALKEAFGLGGNGK